MIKRKGKNNTISCAFSLSESLKQAVAGIGEFSASAAGKCLQIYDELLNVSACVRGSEHPHIAKFVADRTKASFTLLEEQLARFDLLLL